MNVKQLQQVLERFDDMKALIIGDVMIDTYLWGEAERISPEAPVPVVLTKDKEQRLGGAANVALNIKSLGATPLLCAVIGDDEDGRAFTELLETQGISTEGIIKCKGRPTTNKTRIFSRNQQMLRYDRETTEPLDRETSERLVNRILELLDDVDVVIFQDYDKGTLHKDLIVRVVEACREQDIPTTVDPKKRNFLHYRHTTLFKPNLPELKRGLDLQLRQIEKRSLNEAVEQLLEAVPHKNTLITLAAKGIFASVDGTSKIIPAHTRNVADVSGAGDTVISITSLALAAEIDIFLIAKLANIGAGIVCQEVGVMPVPKDQLINEVRVALS